MCTTVERVRLEHNRNGVLPDMPATFEIPTENLSGEIDSWHDWMG